MADYYERRAPEYDDWYLGRGRFAERDRPRFVEEFQHVARMLAALPPARTLDVGCGTGFVTAHLPGAITAFDRSLGMLAVTRRRVRGAFACGDLLALPFRDRAFERVFVGHVYGHLTADRAARFVFEARRVGSEVLVLDSALRPDVQREEVQERVLNDGSAHPVYKRYFDPEGLAEELAPATPLVRGRWFVLVRSDPNAA
jgi:demethylmenaquinone methyltransferase/2-methoxy-6-polyprenyl-1,4-benzoquinol methylase